MRLRFLSTLRDESWRSFFFLSAVVLFSACGGDELTAPVPTVAGTVIASATRTPVAGAKVSIGVNTVTTGADGRFVLTNLTPGTARLSGVATGFEPFDGEITVPPGNTENISIELKRIELHEFGDFAVYIPATVPTVRGVLITLGGPNTKGFASGGPFGAPLPAVEAALQDLGQRFRAFAATHGLAVLGTSRAAMPNSPESDQALIAALQVAAAQSARAELGSAPLLVYGISGGGPEASGLTARHSARVAGLFLKVPAQTETVTSGSILGVPTFLVLAELDTFVDNVMLTTAFMANRRAGALWAIAREPAVPHHSLSLAQRELTTSWMTDVLNLRLNPAAPGPLRTIDEAAGWLGDIATGEFASWSAYTGDRASASWLPSLQTARRWESFVKNGSTPGSSLRVAPAVLTIPVGTVKSFEISEQTGPATRLRHPQ